MKALRRNALHGVTLRQTVVAVVVVALLLMLFSPLLLRQQINSRKVLCSNRQLELWKASQAYNELYDHYPAFRTNWENDDKQPQVGWIGGLLPYLESAGRPKGMAPHPMVQEYLKSHADQNGSHLKEIYISDLVCPADLRAESTDPKAICSYVANTGMPDAQATDKGPADWPANGVLMDADGLSKFSLKLPSPAWIKAHDGLDETLLLAENMDAGHWTDTDETRLGFIWRASYVQGQPARDDKLLAINQLTGKGDGTYRFARPSSHHGRGVNVVYCGGKLQFLSQGIDYVVLANLMNSDITDTKMPGTQEPLEFPYHLKP